MVKQFIKDYFTFNKRERNGIFILSSIILVLLFFDVIEAAFIPEEKIDYSSFEAEVDAYIREKKIYNDSVEAAKTKKFTNEIKTEQLFYFDPNTISEKQWQKLGLNQKQSLTIKNYLSKGGKFYKKEDIRKIYGITESIYTQLEPFMVIKEPIKKDPSSNEAINRSAFFKKEDRLKVEIELNTADSVDLIQLKGIGPVLASRTIKYRNKLGGFLNIEQLGEIHGITQELIQNIGNNIKINPSLVKKININTCNSADLKSHPYINNWNIANSVVNYRNKHGLYKSIEDIRKLDLFNDELYLKLAAYLTIE